MINWLELPSSFLSRGTLIGRIVVGAFVLPLILAVACVTASGTPDDEETKKILLSGDAALRQGRSHYQEALGKYTEALTHNPYSTRGLYSRAELFSMMRQRSECLGDLDRLLKLDSQHFRGLSLRSSLHAQAGHLREAIKDVESVIQVFKALGKTRKVKEFESNLRLLRQHAQTWVPLQKKLEAGETMTQEENVLCVEVLHDVIREFAKDNTELRLQRAECALACGDNRAASEELRFVVQREPQNLRAIALGARAFRALGAVEQARGELRRCLALDPEFVACANLHKLIRFQIRMTKHVTDALEAKDYKRALRELDAANELEKEPPNKDQILRWRCEAAVGLRDTATGFKVCSEAIERLGESNPEAFEIYLQKVELHIMDENLAAAEEQLQHARELQPNHNSVRQYAQKLENLKRAASRKDYYKLLGVKKTAGSADIRRAYRHLAKTIHPDKLRSQNMSPEERQKAETRFRDINEAKEILLDDEKRARYDNGEDPTKPEGQQGGHPFHGHPFPFHFDPFGGGGHGGGGGGGGGGGHQQFFFRFG